MTDRLSWDTWLVDEGIDRTQSLIPSLESLRTPKRPFLDFFDAYLLPQYAQSTAAPYPPWQTIPLKIAEHLDNVQQQQQLTQSQQQQPDAQRRRPRVVFSDEATVTSSNNHNTTTTTTAAAASLHSIVSAAEAMTAKQKKTRLLLDSLLVELKTDFPSDEAVRDYFAVKTLIENLPGANPASATATSSDSASVSSGGGGGGSFPPSLIIPCDPSDPSHSSSSTFSATKGATAAAPPPTTSIKALCDSLLAAHKRAVEWVAAVKGGGGGGSDGGGGSGMGGSSTSSSSASNRTAQLILRNHRASSSVERLGTTNAASATAAAMIDLLDFPSHHFGARHAVQLFFRKILDLSRQPRHQQLTIAQTNHVTRTRGKAAGSEAKEAARGDDQLLRIVFEKTLFPVASPPSPPPTKHFEALFTAAAGPIMDVSTLHLQVHGHIADKHLIVSVNHLKSQQKGGRSSAAGTRIGTSSTTTQAQQEGSPATLRHQPSSGQLSQISGGDDHPQQHHTNVDASDTRSVRSMSVTSTAPISGADHRRASSSLLGSVPLTPASLSAQAHPLGSTPHDYWISLKGIVFSIDLSKESIPAGRRLYYRVFLLPLFSGRECTRGLALLSAAANAHSDFLPYAQYCPKLHRAAESFLLAGDPLWRSTSLPQRMLLLHQKQSRSNNGEWEQLALHPSHWPDSVKQHVNRVFRLFLSDFHPIGKLKDVEDYWF